jgi:hypothetical protein
MLLGQKLPASRTRQFNDAAASMAVAALAPVARFFRHGKSRGLCIGEADPEMKGQAAVAIREGILTRQQLPQLQQSSAMRDHKGTAM